MTHILGFKFCSFMIHKFLAAKVEIYLKILNYTEGFLQTQMSRRTIVEIKVKGKKKTNQFFCPLVVVALLSDTPSGGPKNIKPPVFVFEGVTFINLF